MFRITDRSVAMSLTPTEIQEVTALLSLLVDRNWPAHRGAELKVRTADGQKAVIPIPVYRPPPPRRYVPDDDDGMTEQERDALQAVEEAGADAWPLTGEQVAEKSGYEYSSKFRDMLAGLIRRGRLKRGPNGKGYQPPHA